MYVWGGVELVTFLFMALNGVSVGVIPRIAIVIALVRHAILRVEKGLDLSLFLVT